MDKVPNMISTKDLSYFNELFTLSFVASKKCNQYASAVTNEELKALLEKISKIHSEHCHKIVAILS